LRDYAKAFNSLACSEGILLIVLKIFNYQFSMNASIFNNQTESYVFFGNWLIGNLLKIENW